MTQKKSRKTGGFPFKSLVFLTLCLMVFFVAVDRKDLPPRIAGNKLVTSYYKAREGILHKTPPPAKERIEKGYSDRERAKMETLINNKAE